ncbi:MAG TPA: hypothetical protein VN700_11005 [Vicinamibacterales bacterium]|nr:hypothetical protein [Vicinamibacterales bacterium]
MTSSTRSRLTAALWLSAAAWVIFLFSTHSAYGVTWDEPDWFLYGETQRQWLLDWSTTRPLNDPRDFFHYGTLPSLAAATGRWLFHDATGLLPVNQAWHTANLLFSLILTAGLLVWSRSTLGTRGAIWTMVIWAAWPRLWPDWHNNISDLPGAALSLWAAWAAWRCAEDPEGRWRDYIRLGVLFGLAYSCRAPNVPALAGAIGVWLGCLRLLGRQWPRRMALGVVAAVAVALLTVKVANPAFWHRSVLLQVFYLDPKAIARSGIGYTILWFGGELYRSRAVPWFYAPYVFLISTPPALLVVLSASAIRAAASIRRVPPFVLLWLILGACSVGKHVLGMGNYDGVRHFLEAFAPLTLFAAWGVEQWWSQQTARGWRPSAIATAAAVMIALGVSLVSAARIHPYQTGYFNVFAGRLESAWNRFEFDYFGQGLLDASEWMKREVGDRPATVHVPFVGHVMDWYLPSNFTIRGEGTPEMIGAATSGDWMVLANRKSRLIRSNLEFACPTGWTLVHEARAAEDLPPAALICRR